MVPGLMALLAAYVFTTRTLTHSIGSGFEGMARAAATRIAAAVDSEVDRAIRLASTSRYLRQAIDIANGRYAGNQHVLALGEETPAARHTDRTASFVAKSELAAYLSERAHQTGSYARVTVTDRRGTALVSTDDHERDDHQQEPWWQEAYQAEPGSAYVGTLRFDSTLNEYVFEVAVPIVGSEDKPALGVIELLIRRTVLLDTVRPIRIGKTGYGMLLDTGGTPLLCPVLPPTQHLMQDVIESRLAKEQPGWLTMGMAATIP